jgi:hypothetical protein
MCLPTLEDFIHFTLSAFETLFIHELISNYFTKYRTYIRKHLDLYAYIWYHMYMEKQLI